MKPSSQIARRPRASQPAVPKRRLAIAHHELREHHILGHLESGEPVTQRDLSRELGIALGLTNLLVRRLVTKGWVRIRRVNRSRLLYLVTPAGLAAKARLTRTYVRESVLFYRETRDSVRAQLTSLSAGLGASTERQPIVFFGGGEIAEIAYVCLQEAPLELVGLVDDASARPFFGTPVYRPAELVGTTVAGRPFARLVVTSVADEHDVRAQLAQCQVPPDVVWWL